MFGIVIEVGGVTGGEPWRRLPLLVVGLVLAGGALGALGALLGALAREARTASLLALLVVLPVVFLGLSRRARPARRAGSATRFRSPTRSSSSARRCTTSSPWGEVLRESLWLVALGAVFGGLARLEARRLLV